MQLFVELGQKKVLKAVLMVCS